MSNSIKSIKLEPISTIKSPISKSEKGYVAESTLYDEAGKKIAFGTGHFVKSNTKLSKDIGYG